MSNPFRFLPKPFHSRWFVAVILYIAASSPIGSHGFHYNFQSNVVVAMYRSNTNPMGRNNVVGCPLVKPLRNFDLRSVLGSWNVIQYYASSEEATEYACMRCVFDIVDGGQIVMNFTYQFADDPEREWLQGNITWKVPDEMMPSHWVHAEDPYEGVYNTYILDTDGVGWALIMHCAEKTKTPRYLSALLLSREKRLDINVLNFLRDKLPRYDIDLSLMFDIDQTVECDAVEQQRKA